MRARLRLKSRLSELNRLARAVISLGVLQHLPEGIVSDLNLVLEEVVSNVIRHGYRGREDGEVSIGLHLTGRVVTITVEDEGTPFNPLDHPDPQLAMPPEERMVGGLGIYLVRQLMDEVNYRTEGGAIF